MKIEQIQVGGVLLECVGKDFLVVLLRDVHDETLLKSLVRPYGVVVVVEDELRVRGDPLHGLCPGCGERETELFHLRPPGFLPNLVLCVAEVVQIGTALKNYDSGSDTFLCSQDITL